MTHRGPCQPRPFCDSVIFAAVVEEEPGVLGAAGPLPQVGAGAAGLHRECPAKDTPGVRYPRAGVAVALLLQPRWGLWCHVQHLARDEAGAMPL